jgi:surface antigen
MVLKSRAILAIAALVATSLPAIPAPAAAAAQSAEPNAEGRCENQQSRRRRGALIGGIGGNILRRAVPGSGSAVAGLVPTEQILSEAITALLDCREREQAATATNEAVRGGVGTTSTWQSESRPGVSGSSTVTARSSEGGDDCMTVTDVIIVDGAETRAPKRMCRRPPQNRYVRV